MEIKRRLFRRCGGRELISACSEMSFSESFLIWFINLGSSACRSVLNKHSDWVVINSSSVATVQQQQQQLKTTNTFQTFRQELITRLRSLGKVLNSSSSLMSVDMRLSHFVSRCHISKRVRVVTGSANCQSTVSTRLRYGDCNKLLTAHVTGQFN